MKDRDLISAPARHRGAGEWRRFFFVCGAVALSVLLLLVRRELTAPRYGVSEEPVNSRPSYGIGICRKLSGRVTVILLFVDDGESAWSAAEAAAFEEHQVYPALDFLEKEAARYGVALAFSTRRYTAGTESGVRYDGIVNRDIRADGSNKDVLEQAARALGYPDANGMHAALAAQTGGEVVFLTFHNKDGVSYARVQEGEVGCYAEHCVIFADYLNEKMPVRLHASRAPTVAHEILHLYGAADFYGVGRREAISERLYPDDIMLLSSGAIAVQRVRDATAYFVGWLDTPPEVCYIPAWWEESIS